MSHLWLHNGVFPDWIAEDVFILRCCEMYGCTPSQLQGEDWHLVARHRAIMAAEQKYREADSKARQTKAPKRGRRGR